MSPHLEFKFVSSVLNYWQKLLYLFGACRCIAVKTTLSEETLKTAGPSLIRKEIGNVSLQDILSGGSDGYSM